MIEYPPGSGHYVMVIGPQQEADLLRPITSEEMLQWALLDEWVNMTIGEPEEGYWENLDDEEPE